MSVQRAKAVIDALSNQTVTNEKAESIVRSYLNNYEGDVSTIADAFLRSVTVHIKETCRTSAGRKWEKDRVSKAEAEQAGYDEMPSEPEA